MRPVALSAAALVAETDAMVAALPPRRRRARQTLPPAFRRRVEARKLASCLRPLGWRSPAAIVRQRKPGYRALAAEQTAALATLPAGLQVGTVAGFVAGDARGDAKPHLVTPDGRGGVAFVPVTAQPEVRGRWVDVRRFYLMTAKGEVSLRGETMVAWI